MDFCRTKLLSSLHPEIKTLIKKWLTYFKLRSQKLNKQLLNVWFVRGLLAGKSKVDPLKYKKIYKNLMPPNKDIRQKDCILVNRKLLRNEWTNQRRKRKRWTGILPLRPTNWQDICHFRTQFKNSEIIFYFLLAGNFGL